MQFIETLIRFLSRQFQKVYSKVDISKIIFQIKIPGVLNGPSRSDLDAK
jgi:hypothetical protein